MSDHDCAASDRVVLCEGDDVFVERCACGRVRYEQDGRRMMAWFWTPDYGPFPWLYAYADDTPNTPDGPEVWKFPDTLTPSESGS